MSKRTFVTKSGDTWEWEESKETKKALAQYWACLLYTSPSPRDATLSRMPSSA